MNKRVGVVIVMGILLVGIVNASLVGFLSNTVSGEINVLGLNFYANSDGLLTLNEPSDNIALTEITEDGLATWKYEFDEATGFYRMDLRIIAKARAIFNEGYLGNETNAPVELEFGYLNGSAKRMLCSDIVEINIEDDFNEYEISCENIDCDFDIDGFYYRIVSNGENVRYKIQLHDAKTKVEVRGASN